MILLLVIVVLVCLILVAACNNLIRLRQDVKTSWSAIEVELTRRNSQMRELNTTVGSFLSMLLAGLMGIKTETYLKWMMRKFGKTCACNSKLRDVSLP